MWKWTRQSLALGVRGDMLAWCWMQQGLGGFGCSNALSAVLTLLYHPDGFYARGCSGAGTNRKLASFQSAARGVLPRPATISASRSYNLDSQHTALTHKDPEILASDCSFARTVHRADQQQDLKNNALPVALLWIPFVGPSVYQEGTGV